MKGILKKVTGVLKFGLGILPYAMAIGGLCLGMTFLVVEDKAENKAIKNFKETQSFLHQQTEDLNFLNSALEAGEINAEAYEEQIEYLNDDDYAKTLINLPVNYEFKEELKASVKGYKIAALTSCITAAVGCIASQIYLQTNISEDLIDSAKDDFKYSKRRKEKLVKEGPLEVEI